MYVRRVGAAQCRIEVVRGREAYICGSSLPTAAVRSCTFGTSVSLACTRSEGPRITTPLLVG